MLADRAAARRAALARGHRRRLRAAGGADGRAAGGAVPTGRLLGTAAVGVGLVTLLYAGSALPVPGRTPQLLPSMTIPDAGPALAARAVEWVGVGLLIQALGVFAAVALGARAARRRLLDEPQRHRVRLRRTAVRRDLRRGAGRAAAGPGHGRGVDVPADAGVAGGRCAARALGLRRWAGLRGPVRAAGHPDRGARAPGSGGAARCGPAGSGRCPATWRSRWRSWRCCRRGPSGWERSPGCGRRRWSVSGPGW